MPFDLLIYSLAGNLRKVSCTLESIPLNIVNARFFCNFYDKFLVDNYSIERGETQDQYSFAKKEEICTSQLESHNLARCSN